MVNPQGAHPGGRPAHCDDTTWPTSLDGAALYRWAQRAVACLSARRAELNKLNVFPVPDADTGSNMAYTMEAALAEVEKQLAGVADTELGVHQVAAALATGSVRGVRGNSGVVLSQVLRGIAQVAAQGNIDGMAIRNCLDIALGMVERAINDPVEGTVLTVLRATSQATHNSADTSLHSVVTTAVEAAQVALEQTPSQLEVLRKAGVVDAGAQGFVFLLETLLDQIEDRQQTTNPTTNSEPEPEVTIIGHAAHGREVELEIVFYYRVNTDTGTLACLENAISPLGNSFMIARDSETSGTVHIHTTEAGTVIETAFTLGEVSNLRLEVLPDTPPLDVPARIVVAVTPPGMLAQLFRDAGAVVVTIPAISSENSRDENAIVSDILAVARQCSAEEVILLPNGLMSKRELTSTELASEASERSMTILPTTRPVSGLAALAVHDPTQPVAVDSYTMFETASNMRTADLYASERAALTQAGACSKGDILVESEGNIIFIAENIQDAVKHTCEVLLLGGGELITILATDDALEQLNVEQLKNSLGPNRDVDFSIYSAEGMKHSIEIGVE